MHGHSRAKSSIMLFIFLSLLSCQRIHFGIGRRLYAVPESFNDTVYGITDRLYKKPNCKYIVFKEEVGSCFGAPLVAEARIIWTDGKQNFQRVIAKPNSTKKKVIDKTVEKNSSALFNYFVFNRVDTITTLPQKGFEMDPISYCEITVREGNLFYSKRFEMVPFFSTKDTLHPLYVFVKMIKEH